MITRFNRCFSGWAFAIMASDVGDDPLRGLSAKGRDIGQIRLADVGRRRPCRDLIGARLGSHEPRQVEW